MGVTGSSGRWRIAAGVYGVLTLLLLAPVFAARVPCLGDYLNHLARISIIAHLGSSAALRGFYRTRLLIVPYYGMDVPVLLLSQVMSVYAAGRVFVAACVLMPVAAVAVLRRAVLGRVGLVPVLAGLFCYNQSLARGYMNYLFSSGLAVMLFAGWIATAQWPARRRIPVFAAGLLGLEMCHAFAMLGYCVLVAGFELAAAWRAWLDRRRAIGGLAVAGAQALPALALAVAIRQSAPGAGPSWHYGTALDKLGAALSPLYFPSGLAQGDMVIAASLGFLVCCAGLLARRMRLAPALRGPAAAMAVTCVLMPSVLFYAWGCDSRLPLTLVMVLLGGLSVRPLGRAGTAAILAGALLLIGARAGGSVMLLRALDRQVGDVRWTVAALPVGQRLLVVDAAPADAPGRVAPVATTGHIALVAAIDRQAFVPFLFTGMLPLAPAPAMVNAGSGASEAVSMTQLWDGMGRQDPVGGPPARGWGGHVYWLGWPAKFDFVLVETFGARIGALPGRLRLVRHGRVADLYAIIKDRA